MNPGGAKEKNRAGELRWAQVDGRGALPGRRRRNPVRRTRFRACRVGL